MVGDRVLMKRWINRNGNWWYSKTCLDNFQSFSGPLKKVINYL